MGVREVSRGLGAAIVLAAVGHLAAGCTLVLDAGDHQGGTVGDGGAGDGGGDAIPPQCDMDHDGFAADDVECGGTDCDDTDPDRHPGALPICGNGKVESCPGDVSPAPTDLFASTVAIGVIPPTDVLTGSNAFRPEIAMAAVSLGAAGGALVFAMEDDGTGVYRPVRSDVALADLTSARQPLLGAGSGGANLSETAEATSIDAIGKGASRTQVGIIFVDSSNGDGYLGTLDLAAGTSTISGINPSSGTYLDEPGIESNSFITRITDGGAERFVWQVYDTAPAVLGQAMTGVPSGNPIRMVVSTGSEVMLQDENGAFWFYGSFVSDPPASDSILNQTGKAAWAYVSGSTYVLAYHRTGTVTFVPYDCPDPATMDLCGPQPVLNPYATVSTMGGIGEVPAGLALPDGRVAFLITERHDDGDRLVLQVLDASLFDITTPRIPLVDLQGTGDRIGDARIDLMQVGETTSLVVAASVVPSGDTDAERVVLTGIRACSAD